MSIPAFDFAGSAYATATLPHGLLPTPRPTLGTVVKDANDFQAKLERLGRDLSSPGMREWLSKHVEASKTGFKIGIKIGFVVVALIALKEKAVGAAVGIEALEKGLGITDKVLGLADDVKTFAHQLVQEFASKMTCSM
jgi:hypothetical protein